MLDWALEYASKGMPVFPLNGKVPLTPRGFKDCTINPGTITEWWEAHPNANIGMPTGATSGWVVLDVDKGNGGFASLAALPEGKLDGLLVHTGGGGYHVYFKHPGFEIKNKTRLNGLDGIDVRGDGGYVVVPPSIHPDTGKPYKWSPFNKMGPEPVVMPSWLIEMCKEPERKAPLSMPEEGYFPEGTRKTSLMSWAGKLRRDGFEEAELSAALHAMNESRCNPPLPPHEVQSVVNSALRYEAVHRLTDVTGEGHGGGAGPLLIRAGDLAAATNAYLADKEKVKGEPTLLTELDKLLGGGKRLGEVTAWHAEAKTGKNTLWHFLMYAWLELGLPIGYASRELSPDSEVLPDLLARKYRENSRLVEMTRERASRYGEALGRWPLYFAQGYGYFPLDDIKKWVDAGQEAGISYFWFDHLHYMLEDPEDHKEASKLIKEIKTLAKERNVHIDIIIQPNKLAPDQKLGLGSMKGGSAMGQAIDNLITLERVKHREDGVEQDLMKLSLVAARSKLAKHGHFYMEYDRDTCNYTVVEKQITPVPRLHSIGGGGRYPYGHVGGTEFLVNSAS